MLMAVDAISIRELVVSVVAVGVHGRKREVRAVVVLAGYSQWMITAATVVVVVHAMVVLLEWLAEGDQAAPTHNFFCVKKIKSNRQTNKQTNKQIKSIFLKSH
jgi:hypothetical protein